MTIRELEIRAIFDCIAANRCISIAVHLASETCDDSTIDDAIVEFLRAGISIPFSAKDAKWVPDGYIFVPNDGDVPVEASAGSLLDSDTAESVGEGRWLSPAQWKKLQARCHEDPDTARCQ
jgi:hypothetical protein